MIEVLILSLMVLIFSFIHELGHFFMAKILGIKVIKFGFKIIPIPHFFITTPWIRNKKNRMMFLFAGLALILLLFFLFLPLNFKGVELVKKALLIQIIFDTNPFFSDVVFAMIMPLNTENNATSFYEIYKRKYSKHKFSISWYLHLVLWILIPIYLIKN
tara:strand:- start:1623 stop:2099 length:477 start_codon:yes stop_codon:yes gene_type:complete